MKASELVKLLQDGIEKYGDHPVYMLDDYEYVGMVTFLHNDVNVKMWGGSRFELDWSREDILEIEYCDLDAEPDVEPGKFYLAKVMEERKGDDNIQGR